MKKGGLQLLVKSGCSAHMIDPTTIPNAEQHLHQHQELRPPQTVYRAGSHELLATGTAMLELALTTTLTASNVSVCLYLAFVVVVRSASKHGGGDNIFAS